MPIPPKLYLIRVAESRLIVRPVVAKALDSQEKQIVWQRDGGTSCISRIQNKGKEFEDYVFAFIVPPSLFSDCDTGKHVRPASIRYLPSL